VRIFCGLTNVDDVVAAALVNERGGVIATSEVSDDPLGYVSLCRMWIRHADLACVSVADNGTTHTLAELSRAAGQATASATVDSLDGGEPIDIAVQIARKLATGELATVTGSTRSALVRRLVTSVHALTGSSHAGQVALIELLRQCHPAALTAWEDPTEPAALELLCAVPEPADSAEADPSVLADKLRDRIEPRRVNRMVTALAQAAKTHEYRPDAGVAQAIGSTAESVLACHRATEALAASLSHHLSTLQRRRKSAGEAAIPQPRQHDIRTAERPEPRRGESRTAERPEPRRGETRTAERPEPRRDGTQQQAPQQPLSPPPGKLPLPKPPSPNRSKTAGKPPAEPLTVPLPMRPGTSEPAGQPRGEDSLPGGFPRMPEPPEFVEPLTSDFRPLNLSNGPDLLSAPASDLPPELDEADDDLLIFSQARSAWFTGPAAIEDDEDAWSGPVDEGWRAAAAVATSEAPDSETTISGLPRRVPQANLVPGSAIFSDAPPTPIKRDASALARHTAGYFRGWGRARRETVGAGSRS
jgi:hypothetical protein